MHGSGEGPRENETTPPKKNPCNSHHESWVSWVHLIQDSECRHEDVNTHQTVSAVCSRCIPLRCCKLLVWRMVAIPNHSKKFQRKWASSNQNTCMSLSCPPSHTLFSSFSCNLEFAILRSAAPIWLDTYWASLPNMPKLAPSWLFKGRVCQSGCLDGYWASLPSRLKLTPSWFFKGRVSQSGCLDWYWASLPSRLKLTPSWFFKKRARLSLYGWVPNIRGRELPLRSGKCNMQVSHANMSTCFQHTQVQIYVQFQRCI